MSIDHVDENTRTTHCSLCGKPWIDHEAEKISGQCAYDGCKVRAWPISLGARLCRDHAACALPDTERERDEAIATIRKLRAALADMDHEWLSRLVHEAGLSDELGRMNAIERVAGIARAALAESERWEVQ